MAINQYTKRISCTNLSAINEFARFYRCVHCLRLTMMCVCVRFYFAQCFFLSPPLCCCAWSDLWFERLFQHTHTSAKLIAHMPDTTILFSAHYYCCCCSFFLNAILVFYHSQRKSSGFFVVGIKLLTSQNAKPYIAHEIVYITPPIRFIAFRIKPWSSCALRVRK